MNQYQITHEVEDVAAEWSLKRRVVNGEPEYFGANPCGYGATKDGFILFADGRAWDRKSGTSYTSVEVAQMAGISPRHYGPVARWIEDREARA
jgi:hypothetical protein